jgi:deoxyribodipyrimidine photo-lyase
MSLTSSRSSASSARVGVLVHEDDLDAESLRRDHPWLTTGGVVAAAGFADAAERSPMTVSDLVAGFTSAALADGAARARDAADRAAIVLPDTVPSTMLRWAEAERLDTVVVPDAPVGPVQDRIAVLRNALASEGVTLTTARRQWDALAWPHASRGFFAFRDRIPSLLHAQGL